MTPGDTITLVTGERVTYVRESRGGLRVRTGSGGERTVSMDRVRGERPAPTVPARKSRRARIGHRVAVTRPTRSQP